MTTPARFSSLCLLVGSLAFGCAAPGGDLPTDIDGIDGVDSVDSVDTRTFLVDGEYVELDVQHQGDLMVAEGDVVMDEDAMIPEAEPGVQALFSVRGTGQLWPRGVIPYRINASVTTPKRVMRAIREWEEKTHVRFVRRTNQAAYVVFKEAAGNTVCKSNPGYNGGKRIVYLRDTAVRSACSTAVITHEIGHILGFWHEHTRPDRDDHVRIIWKNVPDAAQFRVRTSNGRKLGPYDMKSTMHYRSYSLTSNGKPSIRKRNGSLILHDWATLSSGDIANTNRLYP